MLPKTAITIKRITNASTVGERAVNTSSTVLSGDRRVVVIPNNKVYDIFGAGGVNGKAKYLVYLEAGDGVLKAGDVLEFTLGGLSQRCIHKFTQPMTMTIQNRVAEAYFESENK